LPEVFGELKAIGRPQHAPAEANRDSQDAAGKRV